jgi:hypothetical protein
VTVFKVVRKADNLEPVVYGGAVKFWKPSDEVGGNLFTAGEVSKFGFDDFRFRLVPVEARELP